jgi:hypothetical protein
MTEILALLQTIAPLFEKTSLRQLSQVIFGMLVASGWITGSDILLMKIASPVGNVGRSEVDRLLTIHPRRKRP